MTSVVPNWDTSWTTTSINNSTITDTSTATTAAIDNDLKAVTEISVEVTYGSTATEGVKVYILRDIDGTDFEAVADNPTGFQMAVTVGATRRKTFPIPGDRISKFKVHITNDSGDSVSNTSVRYRQATIDIV